jgi:hypothetical protein
LLKAVFLKIGVLWPPVLVDTRVDLGERKLENVFSIFSVSLG